MRMRGAAWLALALISASAPARPAAIAVEQRYGSTVAATTVDGCAVSLDHDPRWHSLRYRNDCAQPLAAKVALFAELLAALFGDGGMPAEVVGLGLGRLVDFPELSARVALAVRASGAWDAGKRRFAAQAGGEPGGLNRPFAAMLDREALFEPFLAALRPYGVAGGTASVEKVLVGPPRMTPAADALLAAGVGAEEGLPFDAQVWVNLRRGEGDRR